MARRYVDVICLNERTGNLKPLYLVWNETVKMPIKKVKEVCPKSALKQGGTGYRYTCLFERDQVGHLYYDRGKWYVEMIDYVV